jgi:two-component system cell cycle response regulator DivK
VDAKPLILVVEDDPASQLLARTLLEHAGYRAATASTSDDALHQIDVELPVLILMDLELPGRDGLSLTRLLKTMSPTTAIPIVAMTSHSALQIRHDAIAAGCIGFIAKPVDVGGFADRIREFLSRSLEC